MNKRIWLTTLTLALSLAASSTLHAQTLQTGTWTGTATGPNGSTDVTFEVELMPPVWTPDGTRVVSAGSQLTITYNSAQGPISLRNIQLDGDRLTYEFTAGDFDVTCSLTRQDDGSYTGPCGVGGGQGGRHTMHPPTD